MGAPADPRTALAARAASEPEQPGLIYFDEHQARWRWKSWRELEHAVRQLESAQPAVAGAAGNLGHPIVPSVARDLAQPVMPSAAKNLAQPVMPSAARDLAQPVMPSAVEDLAQLVVPSAARDLRVPEGAPPWPSPEIVIAALARPDLDEAAGRALAALPPLPIGSDRPIALLAAEPVDAEPAGFLAWAVAAGAALVVPAGPGLVAWSLAWTRPTHLALAAAELPELRGALLSLEKPRTLRRRLRRLRHLLVWGAGSTPDAAESAAWAELGVLLTPWPPG